MQRLILSLLFVLLSLLVYSCKTVKPCPPNADAGNPGSIINSVGNDELPIVFGNYLYYMTQKDAKSKIENLYRSEIVNGYFTTPKPAVDLPLESFPTFSTPSFYNNSRTGEKEAYFAAYSPKAKAGNRNIYFTRYLGNEWETPHLLEFGISTKAFESQPAISPDGGFMIFVSDRPGGLGETDLYITCRQDDYTWSKPTNLGSEINTNGKEITPYISQDGSLYFASDGYTLNTKLDIIKALLIQKNTWGSAKALSYPINTESDDISPCIWNDRFILASNRKGGCGGYDIYSFNNCGPVFIEGQVEAGDFVVPFNGKAAILDSTGKQLAVATVEENGKFNFQIEPNHSYILKYTNTCRPDYEAIKFIHAPCSDSSTIKILLSLSISSNENEFSFEKYKVPFFVSGYYKPNTSRNLDALRQLFEYNLLGTSDSTKYIENPGEEYDDASVKVDKALAEAVAFIIGKFEYLTGECSSGNEELTITLAGYADPRPISESARYAGDDLGEDIGDIHIKRGDAMTNMLLTQLRAYYMAKELQTLLEKEEKYQHFKDRILWVVSGKGIDENNPLADPLKRRVDIQIGLVNK